MPWSIVFLATLSLCWFTVSVFGRPVISSTLIRGGSSPMSTVDSFVSSTEAPPADDDESSSSIDIVFSDLDGTLIHYPKTMSSITSQGIVQLPPSSTGMVGVISHGTLDLCHSIRSSGVKLVLISGMRASTLFKRLPYLPRADAYCCEAGGRIFYAIPDQRPNSVKVEPYVYDTDAPSSATEPFYLVEDMEWRKKMEHLEAAGTDGYVGNEVGSDDVSSTIVPITSRNGALWNHARSLMAQGFVIDTKGYSTCFRVNRNQQESDAIANFESLLAGTIPCRPELSTSSNLGCVDFYPASSGKKNCCEYLAKRFSPYDNALRNRCLCLCDDDNDIEMALACLHAYVPQVTSDSMLRTIRTHPTQLTLTKMDKDSDEEYDDMKATERALSLVLDRIGVES